jgi:myo-inositol-1(or 4)-monophosphatase
MKRPFPTESAALVACLEELCDVACHAARAAGDLIAAHPAVDQGQVSRKETGGNSLAATVLTEVDALAQAQIVDRLALSREEWDIGLLAEEAPDDHSRLSADAFWCIDPLDGTLPFIEGIPGYAVSIALVARAGVSLLGVVYDPLERRLYRAVRGAGAYRDEQPWRASPTRAAGRPLRVFADRSSAGDRRFSAVTARLERLSGQLTYEGLQVHVGAGAVMNACSTLECAPACYFKLPKAAPGGGNLWDYAATTCIATEYGASVTDSRGQPLALNNPQTVMLNHCGVCFASDDQLARRLLCLLRDVPEVAATAGSDFAP